ncbi:GNAT family N-acetyltransferase [Neobacillus massiliamazoniensis]|uniref:Acetyltransferase n=1 Tax=Neobacillus massiliamazoniensis TaxID=1499688 RepID=A0A0U1P3S5_9BACI|nr:GNAT family protein [Neobacillus massiliamazoniensis]CRK84866.1 acetyltransferase [Neobacillus massiliamazoniensis]
MFEESNLITFRFTQLKDLDFVCTLESEKENAQFIIPWSVEKHKAALDDKDFLHLIIESKIDNRKVGFIILSGILNPHNSIEFLRITMDEKGKGFGKEAFRLIKDWAFYRHNANRLWLDVKVNNQRAITLYRNQGFVMEGTLRECIKNGDVYESLHIMSILKDELLGKKNSYSVRN